MAVVPSAQFIAPQSGGFEPQRSYDFTVELYNVVGAATISLALKSAFFPNGQSGVIDIRYFGESRKVAGPLSFPNGNITCHDYVDQNVAGLLLAWRQLVHDVASNVQGYASAYKSQGAIILLDPAGENERVFLLNGVWPASVTGSGLDYDSSEKFELTIDLVYDSAVPSFLAPTV